jgi:hypothetical protein
MESEMNLTPEVLLGIISAVAGSLTLAIATLAKLIFAELVDCKKDRASLISDAIVRSAKMESLVGVIDRMEKHLEFIDARNVLHDVRHDERQK